MGDPQPLPGFGEIDLDLEEDRSETRRRPSLPDPAAPDSSFGELHLDLGHATEDSTRIVSRELTEALAAKTRPPPMLGPNESSTRAWGGIDEALLGLGETHEADDEAPTSVRKSHPSGRSGSGVASRDGGRVAAMRALYAKGDAAGALALAASLGDSLVPSAHDHPDASVSLEYGEQSLALSDPFGGLIPLDDELAAKPTLAPPAMAASALTLTERQSIPRLRLSMGELLKLKTNHRAGFLLAHVDGMHTLEEILDICAMPTAEALSLIANLENAGVIEFE